MSNRKSTLLVVDDVPDNINVMRGVLGAEYSVKVASNGALALKIAEEQLPDLILLDVMMPGMSGYEVCRELKKKTATRHIPVIFVTALGEVEDEAFGFELGGADYITKPIRAPIVRARVQSQLALASQRCHLELMVAERTGELESINRQLERSNQQLAHTHLIMLQQLGRAADYRDNETGKHILRVGNFSKLLGLACGFPEQRAELLMYASMMHDIGKIGIPDHVLLKPGKLTPEEFEIIKKHPAIGAEIIGQHEADVLDMAREVALTHHEKWNGLGYPQSLKGEEIPIVGRIVAIADVFDALTCVRPYKKAWPMEDAFELVAKEAGQHFDPSLVALFLEREAEVRRIAIEYKDAEEAPGGSS